MFSAQKILSKKYFLLLSLLTLTYFFCFISVKAATNYFPVAANTKNSLGLKLTAGFDLEKNQVGLKISTKSAKTKLEAISLVVDNNASINLSPASSSVFWLDLSSGDHSLIARVADQNGYIEQATSSVFVPHLQAPYLNVYPLTVYVGQKFVLGGQTIYPAKQVVIHLQSKDGEREAVVDTDLSGYFNWSGTLSDQEETIVWAEVLDGSLRSLASNQIKLKAEKMFSVYWLLDLITSAQSYLIFQITVAALLLILLITFLLHFLKRDKNDLTKLNRIRFLSVTENLRQDVIGHVDALAGIKDIPKEEGLPVLLDLQRTLQIVEKYLQSQIKIFTKKKIQTRSVGKTAKKAGKK